MSYTGQRLPNGRRTMLSLGIHPHERSSSAPWPSTPSLTALSSAWPNLNPGKARECELFSERRLCQRNVPPRCGVSLGRRVVGLTYVRMRSELRPSIRRIRAYVAVLVLLGLP